MAPSWGSASSRPRSNFNEFCGNKLKNASNLFTIHRILGVTGEVILSVVFPTTTYQIAADITTFVYPSSGAQRGQRFDPDIPEMVALSGLLIGRRRHYFVARSCSTPLYARLFAFISSMPDQRFGLLLPPLLRLVRPSRRHHF